MLDELRKATNFDDPKQYANYWVETFFHILSDLPECYQGNPGSLAADRWADLPWTETEADLVAIQIRTHPRYGELVEKLAETYPEETSEYWYPYTVAEISEL